MHLILLIFTAHRSSTSSGTGGIRAGIVTSDKANRYQKAVMYCTVYTATGVSN